MKLPKATKLKSGNWRIQIQIDGHRYSCTGTTKKEAQDKAKQIFAGVEMEKRVPMTVGRAMDHLPDGCRECGGDYPDCKDSCPMYDD